MKLNSSGRSNRLMPEASRAIVSVSFKRVQFVGAALVLLGVVGVHAAEVPAVVGHRLLAELLVQEVGELHPHLVEPLRIELDRLLQAPPPALAVGLGVFPALGRVVIDGLAVGVDRRAGALAVVAPARLVVGQHADVAEVLQAPGLAVAAVVQQQFAQPHEEVAHGRVVVVLLRLGQGLDHQLQGADAVALLGVDHLAAAAVLPALELPGDLEPLVLDLHVVLRGGPEQAPIVLVDGDDRFAELVDLVDAVEALQALRALVQVAAHLPRIVGRVEGQLAEAFVGVLVIALFDGVEHFLALGLILAARFGGLRHTAAERHAREQPHAEPLDRFHRRVSWIGSITLT